MNNSKKKTKNDEYSRSHYSASTIDEVPFSWIYCANSQEKQDRCQALGLRELNQRF